jgi:polyhydroxybutyrate depolymerase
MLGFFALLGGVSTPDHIQVTVDGQVRQALIYRPVKGSGNPPVIFGFHGHGGNSRNAARSFELQNYWPEALVVYPQGLPTKSYYDPGGKFNGWSNETGEDNHDIRFYDALYKMAIGQYGGDSQHVFAMGHSNGGQFMYTLWSMRGAQLAGIGSYEGAGGQSVTLTPKPFFITIGSQDRLVPPQLQHRSLDAVFRVNGSSPNGTPFEGQGMLYPGTQPVVYWAYNGGHLFPSAAVPAMVKFFKGLP